MRTSWGQGCGLGGLSHGQGRACPWGQGGASLEGGTWGQQEAAERRVGGVVHGGAAWDAVLEEGGPGLGGAWKGEGAQGTRMQRIERKADRG